MGLGDFIGKALSAAGVGQKDLIEVTDSAIKRMYSARRQMSESDREAAALAFRSMIDELRDRDVATKETAAEMRKVVDENLLHIA